MKRFLTLLLTAAMALSFAACGDNGTTIRNENEKDNVKRDPIAAQYLQDLAVKTADYPVLPAMPNESELDEAFSTIDYDKMGADAYEKAQEKIWEDWDARSNAYYDALKALRSKGTSYPAAFLHFTQETGTLLSAEENTVLSPANLYLAFAMLSETTDGDSRAQLLSLLGLENTDAPRAAGNYVWRDLYGETSTGKTLLGSSVWLNENVPYNEETLQVLAEQYLASTFSAPMGDEKTDKAIGEWINENTGNLLQDAAGEIETDQAADGGGGSSTDGVVNLNTATQAELEELPGVGPVMAAAILAWREENGKFGSVEELQEISGIGPKTYEKLAPLVRT